MLTISNVSDDVIEEIRRDVKSHRIKLSFVPNLYNSFMHNIDLTSLGSIPIIEERETPFQIYHYFKRMFDIFLSPIVLCLTWSIILVTMMVIRINYKANPIFYHDRV